MGSKQVSRQLNCAGGNCNEDMSQSLNLSSKNDYKLEDLKTFTVRGIQFGTNPLIDSKVLSENEGNLDNYSAPPAIDFHNRIGGEFVDPSEIGKNNFVHCFCFLDVEELKNDNDNDSEGIIIEFGEYEYGAPNDFNVETFYFSQKGGLRLYKVKTKLFENYCSLTRVKCRIKKKEILEDIIIGISQNYKWRLEFYDDKNQNSEDFVAILLNYLEIEKYDIYKGSFKMIPDKIQNVLRNV